MFKLSSQITGSEKLTRALKILSGPQARQECAEAINTVAQKYVTPAMREELRKFDRVTPYVERSVRLMKPATAQDLVAEVGPTYRSSAGSKGGKVGVDPQSILQAQELGGRRRDKRSEKLLRQLGLLPSGMQTTIPQNPLPGSEDGYGNLRGSFIQQMLAYLQAFQSAGSSANMSAKRRADLHRGHTRAMSAKRQAQFTGPTMGRRYFVVGARNVVAIEGGEMVKRTMASSTHLAPGVYAALGPQGKTLRPVLLFVKAPSYQSRIDLSLKHKQADIYNRLGKLFRARAYAAAGL